LGEDEEWCRREYGVCDMQDTLGMSGDGKKQEQEELR
jgi:hypothetical protein